MRLRKIVKRAVIYLDTMDNKNINKTEQVNKPQFLKSAEYYSQVIGVTFFPSYQVQATKEVSKGDPIYQHCGFLGLKKKKVGEEKESIFSVSDAVTNVYYATKSEIERRNKSLFVDDDKVFKKAKVVINRKNNFDETYWFGTNLEANNFLEEVKNKCEQCGNKLL